MRCESGKCVLIEDEEQFEIVRILDHRGRNLGEKATSVSSLFVGLAMGLSTTHGNQKKIYRPGVAKGLAKKPLVTTGSLLNSNCLPIKEYYGATVSNAKTSLSRHTAQCLLLQLQSVQLHATVALSDVGEHTYLSSNQ